MSSAKCRPFCLGLNVLMLMSHPCVEKFHKENLYLCLVSCSYCHFSLLLAGLTHWGRVTHICVSKIISIGSDNGLSPGRHQAIIWTSAGKLSIRPLGTNFSEVWFEILTCSFKKMRLKVSSAKRRPCCLGLNVLTNWALDKIYLQTTFSNAIAWHFQMQFLEWKHLKLD